MKYKYYICVLILILIVFFSACGAMPEAPVEAAPTETASPEPQAAYVGVYILYLGEDIKNSAWREIPISNEAAALCVKALNEGETVSVGSDSAYLFKLELGDNSVGVFELRGGGYTIGDISADEAVTALLTELGDELGANAFLSLSDFHSIGSAQLLRGKTVLWESSDNAALSRISGLLEQYQGTSASQFQEYDLELRCKLADGRAASLYFATEDGYLYIPPFRYYRFPSESPLRQNGWLDALDLSEWPET